MDYGNESIPTCLGFCGRIPVFNGNDTESSQWSKCTACPRGQRANKYSICEPCEKDVPPYDWMYLLFIVILTLFLHMQYVRNARRFCRMRIFETTEQLAVITENVVSAIISILIFPPKFSMSLYGCEKRTYRDWFPFLFDPVIAYSKSMRCSSEVVFPLFSLPFIHHLVLIVSIIVIRTPLYYILLYKAQNSSPYFYALTSIPFIVATHTIFAGLLYYSFSWILIAGSILAMMIHLIDEEKRYILDMIVHLVTSPNHIGFLLAAMFAMSVGLAAEVIHLGYPALFLVLFVVPIPLFVFLARMPFSRPTDQQPMAPQQ